jgi:sulfite reductase alpha subunit-like flavoprotein
MQTSAHNHLPARHAVNAVARMSKEKRYVRDVY